MSNLSISEFSDLSFSTNGAIQAPAAQNWVVDQAPLTIGATSVPSAAFNAETAYIVIVADGASCSIAWTPAGAENPVAATTDNFLIPANVPMTFGVAGGMKLSCIANS